MEFRPVDIIDKPWGREIWITLTDRYAGKILEIRKGYQTSLQYHTRKKESMYVYRGRLKVLCPEGDFTVMEGESFTINPGDVHRLYAMEDLMIVEISTPELDDIVRLEDDYGRK